MKIPKFKQRSIGEVQPQTKVDIELQLKLDCPAPFFAYALLAAGILPLVYFSKIGGR
jgi:hypothetical protein